MTDLREILFMLCGTAFFAAGVIMLACGLLFDFWLERRHLRLTGRQLMEPPVPLPLLTGFFCGMRLIAPGLPVSRGHTTSIGMAGKGVKGMARLNAVALLAAGAAALPTYLLAPG